MARGGIDPFAALRVSNVPAEPSDAIPQILQRRPSRAKRNRDWERTQYRVTYRGISPELHEALKAIAIELSVPVGDVARAFLEHGLEAYKSGDLVLAPRPRLSAHNNMTLYPSKSE